MLHAALPKSITAINPMIPILNLNEDFFKKKITFLPAGSELTGSTISFNTLRISLFNVIVIWRTQAWQLIWKIRE